jgi:hypothetical protein
VNLIHLIANTHKVMMRHWMTMIVCISRSLDFAPTTHQLCPSAALVLRSPTSKANRSATNARSEIKKNKDLIYYSGLKAYLKED